jgi:hypothetical protein
MVVRAGAHIDDTSHQFELGVEQIFEDITSLKVTLWREIMSV